MNGKLARRSVVFLCALSALTPVAHSTSVAGHIENTIMVELTLEAMQQMTQSPPLYKTGGVFPQTGVSSLDSLNAAYDALSMTPLYDLGLLDAYVAEYGLDRQFEIVLEGPLDVLQVASAYGSDGSVAEADGLLELELDETPNDPHFAESWGHRNTGEFHSYDFSPAVEAFTGPFVGALGFDSQIEIAWEQSQGYGSPDVVIAIIDTGVEMTHPDLEANIWINEVEQNGIPGVDDDNNGMVDDIHGWDFGCDDNDPSPDPWYDQGYHGTSTAGIAAAVANNGIGVAGVAPGCKILPVKVSCNNGGTTAGLVEAIEYAARYADVINISLGVCAEDGWVGWDFQNTAIDNAATSSAVICASAGNSNMPVLKWPARIEHVVAVGAASPCGSRKRTHHDEELVYRSPVLSCLQIADPQSVTCDNHPYWGSHYGNSTPDAAHAVDVLGPTLLPTTDLTGPNGRTNGDYNMHFGGTSCAAPYVSGVAALVRSRYPTSLNYTVARQTYRLATDVVNSESGVGWDRYSGYGFVNAINAVGYDPPRVVLQDKSIASNIDTGTAIPYSSIAFDYDGDTRLDLTISLHDASAQVYQNTSILAGPSAFSLVSVEPGFFPAGQEPDDLRGLAAADFDNDGDIDFFGASAATPRLYVNTGADEPRFEDLAAGTWFGALSTDSWGGAWGDYNRDGWVDLYVLRATGSPAPDLLSAEYDRLFRNDGIQLSGGNPEFLGFTEASDEAGLSIEPTAAVSASWADMDADGDLDLCVGSLSQAYYVGATGSPLFVNQGDGSFLQVAGASEGPRIEKIGYVSGVAWADFDGDGDLDLALSRQSPSGAPIPDNVSLYTNDGTGALSREDASIFGTAILSPMQGIVAADFDLDGAQEILAVPVEVGDAPVLLLNDLQTAGEFSEFGLAAGLHVGSAQGLVAADFNRDGDVDVYLGRPSGGSFFFQNVEGSGVEAPAELVLRVELRSSTRGNNSMGLGSLVRVTAGSLSLLQSVDGGSGRGGQSPAVLTFGLGFYQGETTIEVVWPDGHVQTASAMVPGANLVIIEDDHQPELLDGTVGGYALGHPGGTVDWVFHWRTARSTDVTRDEVEILASAPGAPCTVSATVLHPGDLSTEHSVRPVPGGGYYHELVWKDRECTPRCNFPYRVGSGVFGQPMDRSSEHTFRIPVCIQ